MGALKPLLPYGSGTVLQAVVRSLKASPVDEVLVVLGHRSEEIVPTLADEGARIVPNPRYAEGMLTSIQAGVAAAAHADWLLIALGDQPWLRPATVSALLDAATGHAGIIVPSWGGRRGHPLLLHARYRREIATLDPAVGLRDLFRRHPEAVRYILVPDSEVLADLDTPEEYERAAARLRETPETPRA
jgi:CTP:molybdopterin cytidylyltransferase MocA